MTRSIKYKHIMHTAIIESVAFYLLIFTIVKVLNKVDADNLNDHCSQLGWVIWEKKNVLKNGLA